MEVIVNNRVYRPSKIIEDKNGIIIKEYSYRYGFVKQLVENEINMNRLLKKLGIVYVPELILIEESCNLARLHFKKIEGYSLTCIKYDDVTNKQKYDLFIKIIKKVKLLHLNHILHNDISLSNMIIDDNQEIYMVDFELSERLTNKNYINDINALNEIMYKFFNKRIEVTNMKNIHEYKKKIEGKENELIHSRRIRSKKL